MYPSSPLQWHAVALKLAVRQQLASKEKYDAVPDEIVRGALFVISHDAVIVHRAIGDAVEHGWSGPAASMLRTLLDLVVSEIAILNSRDSHLAAFRYFYASHRFFSRDVESTPESRRQMREQIRSRIRSLPEQDRPAALRFLRERDRPYWFAEEFRSPSEVLEKFGLSGFDWIYKQTSAAAHGGFLGSRIFRDDPDKMDVNARLPFKRHAETVLFASTRVLLDLMQRREQYEDVGLALLIYGITQKFVEFGRANRFDTRPV